MGNAALPKSWREGEYTVTRTTAWSAPGCHEGCGVLCYVKDGKLVKVEGDPEHPFNQGRLCPRCVALPDVVNHPDRLLYPMMRDPSQRGNPDAWERISWDEALDRVESKFKQITADYGAEAIQMFHGTGRDVLWEAQRLAYSMGTPHDVSYLSGLACWMPRLVAYIMTVGCYMMPDCSQRHERRYDDPAWRVPEVLVIWGNNCVQSNPDGFFGDWAVECMRRGSKLIVIDPRLTWLAARADIWLQPRPAVDSAIAIGMLKTIIDEGLYDHAFVDEWTSGFDELCSEISRYEVDSLASAAWVNPEKLKAAARMYAAGNNSAIQLGLAIDMQRHGNAAALAIIDMMAICNNIDRPGGQIFTPDPAGVNNFGWGWEELPQQQQEKLIGYNEYPMIRMGMRLDQPDLCIEQAISEQPYKFRVAFMIGTNPLTCMGTDHAKVKEAIAKLEFIAVADWHMTSTIQAYADLVLPVAMYVEKQGLRYMYTNLGVMDQIEGLEVRGECKGDEEISWLLGKRFNPSMYPWESVEDMITEMLTPAKLSYQDLRTIHWYYDPMEYGRFEKGTLRHDGKVGFSTPTGRIELYSYMAESIGCPPMPYYEEPYLSPVATPDIYQEYPVIVMTGTRNVQFFHSEHRQIPKLREIQPDPWVEINDEWAAEEGIRAGDWLWIENPKGRIRHRAKPTPTLRKGMANLNAGWWFPEMDPHEDPLYGCSGVNPNLLLENGHQGPTGFGADLKSVLCKIYKCKEGEF
ncbi:MAG: molybdopterin-dependent oxidoreductase [Coriobacteriaceae bacterium]|nr:molybdopterin-dependent oxidoreductase [Coriobacteriaceae bacterium]